MSLADIRPIKKNNELCVPRFRKLQLGREHSLYEKTEGKIILHASIRLIFPSVFSHSSLFYAQKKHETGFEPAALALARRCSTTEPLVHFLPKGFIHFERTFKTTY